MSASKELKEAVMDWLSRKGLFCLLSHKYSHMEYSGAHPTYSSFSATTDWNGQLKIHKPMYMGFMHYGLCARCLKCGKIHYGEIKGLPILEPNFS